MEEICNATIVFIDNFGENYCTFCCQLPKYHGGNHKKEGNQYGKSYVLTWKEEPDKEEKKKSEIKLSVAKSKEGKLQTVIA